MDTIKFIGSSSIGIDTFFQSGGLAEAFLRNAGVPEEFVQYAASLVGTPIEYYSCFLSYSSKDDEFARRLYNDLQGKNVRTWFAPEELKIGDRFRSRIDESIRIHDKLVLILSANSVDSDWVETEVESALERERKEGKDVLFPIAIDDEGFTSQQPWAADIRRKRHIGDFRKWKSH
ncbi:MAG TPA: toll/interleukin-1 receptor domain-containing protein, partial [Thermoanaerobaculia bacterium]|nr:toll/interleukin-1 receptor domain-containing protein [Thermoanaerobaculia bacterium]